MGGYLQFGISERFKARITRSRHCHHEGGDVLSAENMSEEKTQAQAQTQLGSPFSAIISATNLVLAFISPSRVRTSSVVSVPLHGGTHGCTESTLRQAGLAEIRLLSDASCADCQQGFRCHNLTTSVSQVHIVPCRGTNAYQCLGSGEAGTMRRNWQAPFGKVESSKKQTSLSSCQSLLTQH